MSDEHLSHYRASGKSLAAILDWLKSAEAIRKARVEFKEKHGAVSTFERKSGFGLSRVVGLGFDADGPAGWNKKPGSDGAEYWEPNRRTKEGKAIIKFMESLSMPGPSKNMGSEFIGEGKWFSPGFEKLGKDYVITQHVKATAPPDAILLKRSKYWAMKERVE